MAVLQEAKGFSKVQLANDIECVPEGVNSIFEYDHARLEPLTSGAICQDPLVFHGWRNRRDDRSRAGSMRRCIART